MRLSSLIEGGQEVIVAGGAELYSEVAKHRSLPIGRTSGHAATSRRDLETDAFRGIAVPLL